MRNSAVHPSGVMRPATHHTASQFGFTSRPSLAIWVSARAPAALVAKTNPLRRSAKVSSSTSKMSCSAPAKSLRMSLTTMWAGSLSWQSAADVEVVVVEGDAHLGRLGGRLALERIALHEPVGGRRRAPDLLVEDTVDRDRRRDADGGQGAPAVGGGDGARPGPTATACHPRACPLRLPATAAAPLRRVVYRDRDDASRAGIGRMPRSRHRRVVDKRHIRGVHFADRRRCGGAAMRLMTRLGFMLALLLAAPVAVWAQATGQITGSVTDTSGAVLPGVTVEATNTATGAVRSAVSGDDGLYTLPLLQPGVYNVKATLAGFRVATAGRRAGDGHRDRAGGVPAGGRPDQRDGDGRRRGHRWSRPPTPPTASSSTSRRWSTCRSTAATSPSSAR